MAEQVWGHPALHVLSLSLALSSQSLQAFSREPQICIIITISSKVISALAALFFTDYSVEL